MKPTVHQPTCLDQVRKDFAVIADNMAVLTTPENLEKIRRKMMMREIRIKQKGGRYGMCMCIFWI